jgi:hypothetical protein
MHKTHYITAALVFLAILALLALPVMAAPVGQFIEVEGQVDLMKVGKLPAQPVKVQDSVEVGDVVRTKSQSRAQIRFVDDTILSIAPESKVAIEEYMFDGAKGERKAVLEVFRGLVHTAVEKVYPEKEPDFIMKTHTAVLGVRGTKWYTMILPQATDIYTEGTKLEVRHRDPNIPGVIILGALQYVRADLMSLGIPVSITPEILQNLQKQMKTGISVSGRGDQGPPSDGMITAPGHRDFIKTATSLQNLFGGLYVPPTPAAAFAFALFDGYLYIFNSQGQTYLSSYGSSSSSVFFPQGAPFSFYGNITPPVETVETPPQTITGQVSGTYRPTSGGFAGNLQVTLNLSPGIIGPGDGGTLTRLSMSGPFTYNKTPYPQLTGQISGTAQVPNDIPRTFSGQLNVGHQ